MSTKPADEEEEILKMFSEGCPNVEPLCYNKETNEKQNKDDSMAISSSGSSRDKY